MLKAYLSATGIISISAPKIIEAASRFNYYNPYPGIIIIFLIIFLGYKSMRRLV